VLLSGFGLDGDFNWIKSKKRNNDDLVLKSNTMELYSMVNWFAKINTEAIEDPKL